MLDFYAQNFVTWSRTLIRLEGLLSMKGVGGEPAEPDADLERIVRVALNSFFEECKKLPFSSSLIAQVDRLRDVREGISNDRIKRERFLAVFDEVRLNSDHELKAHRFYVVPEGDAALMDDSAQFGAVVADHLPGAATDIKSASQCLALNQYTACVFHCMRAAEHGLRALARRFRVKVSDKGKPCRLEDADWNKVVTVSKEKIKRARERAASEKKRQQLERYSDLADRCEYMKDLWRNDIAHTGKVYDDVDAKAVLARTKTFMQGVATELAAESKTSAAAIAAVAH